MCMDTTISAKLKLLLTPEQRTQLNAFCFAYRDALNYASQVSFDHGKLKNSAALQKLCYAALRERFALPSQVACSINRQVAASYKTLWTRWRKHKAARENGWTRKRYKGLDAAPKFISRTATLQYKKDFGFKAGQTVSLATLTGRILCSYAGYQKHLDLIQDGSVDIGAAKLWYQKSKKCYYLIVSLTISHDIEISSLSTVVGVDVGCRNLAVTTTPTHQTAFFSGRKSTHIANQYSLARASLQRKGTRSATRRLIALSGRERRFKADVNHGIAAAIAQPGRLIGMEHLTDIRERTTRTRKRGRRASQKQRRANARMSKWAFAELQAMIAYKARLNGSLAIQIDADYTSQQCPRCGHTSRENRPQGAVMFRCVCCHYTLHSDLIGAKNLVMRTLLVRQECINTGALSTPPDVTNDEAKAARLQHYAELRWSSVTSPTASALGS